MFERALLLATATVSALLVTAVGPRPLRAQSDVAALRRQYDAVESRRIVAASALDSLRRAARRVLDDSLLAGGRTVAFVSAQLTLDDRERLSTALRDEWRALERAFGASAPLLLDGIAWKVEAMLRRGVRGDLRLEFESPLGGSRYVMLSSPIDARVVARVSRRVAAEQATRLHPVLAAYVGDGGVTFDSLGDERVAAARDLALAGSALGRRCLEGATNDCRRVLRPTEGASVLNRYFEPGDWPDLARRARSPSSGDRTEWNRAREECVERGEREVCEAVLRAATPPVPFRREVRGTFVVDALLAGGEKGLERLVAARGDFLGDPIGLLAHVAGHSDESLAASWQARVAVAGREASRHPVAGVLVSSVAWGLLLLGGATLRRPS